MDLTSQDRRGSSRQERWRESKYTYIPVLESRSFGYRSSGHPFWALSNDFKALRAVGWTSGIIAGGKRVGPA